jgi:hypothetical protein
MTADHQCQELLSLLIICTPSTWAVQRTDVNTLRAAQWLMTRDTLDRLITLSMTNCHNLTGNRPVELWLEMNTVLTLNHPVYPLSDVNKQPSKTLIQPNTQPVEYSAHWHSTESYTLYIKTAQCTIQNINFTITTDDECKRAAPDSFRATQAFNQFLFELVE